jgi:hypothetical protein
MILFSGGFVMNVKHQSREYKDPYIHLVTQEEMYIQGVGQETAVVATQLVTQGKKIYTLTHTNGSWILDKCDGSTPAAVSGDYTPPFRVRYLKCWGQTEQSADLTNFCMVYDIPQSEGVVDYWAVGIMHKIWITRLHLGNSSFSEGIVTLIG